MRCKHCKRERPDYGVDLSCAKGGYCEWENNPGLLEPAERWAGTAGKTTSPINVSWAKGNGTAGRRMSWAFPNTAIVEGLEVEPFQSHSGACVSYSGFITSLQVGMVDYMHMGPYPISMWSPGMPGVNLWLPSVLPGHHFSIETQGFYGRIRPRGRVIDP